jgi:quercetin dioxygenase-like cupin family protein
MNENVPMKIWAAALIGLAALAGGAANAAEPVLHNVADMKFGAFPGLPTCATGSVQHGDPTKEPSIILVKLAKGCAIPWHWHTANEHVMMTAGQGYMEMKDNPNAKTLRAGGFAEMPSKHVHRFECVSKTCLLYVYSDAAFDIHYVDAQGSEIPADDALKAVKETAAK